LRRDGFEKLADRGGTVRGHVVLVEGEDRRLRRVHLPADAIGDDEDFVTLRFEVILQRAAGFDGAAVGRGLRWNACYGICCLRCQRSGGNRQEQREYICRTQN